MYIFGKNGNYKNIKNLRGYKMTFIGMISDYKTFENVVKAFEDFAKLVDENRTFSCKW